MNESNLKFRGWDRAERILCPVGNIRFGDGGGVFLEGNAPTPDRDMGDFYQLGTPDGHFVPFADVELMQFTGLKDKNGVEIYEGDIVEFHEGDDRAIYLVAFKAGMFYLDHHEDQEYDEGLSYGWDGDDQIVSRAVIGNIYENPELVEFAAAA